MSEAEESQPVHMDPNQAAVPPWLVHFIAQLNQSSAKVMRTRVPDGEGKQVPKYNDPRALREFIGLELVPQLVQVLAVLSEATAYAHQEGLDAGLNVSRLRQWATGHFRALGARDLGDNPGLSSETLDAFGNAFFALGTYLKEKYPDDEETTAKYNAVSEAYAKVIEEARTGGDVDDEDDDDEDDDGDDEE